MEEKTASVWGPDPHVMYSTAQPKSNCDDTSHPTHHTYCSLLLGTTCVQCLYTVVYKSNKVDRIYISITMGKVDGFPLGQQNLSAWSKKYVEVDGFVKKWPLVGSTVGICITLYSGNLLVHINILHLFQSWETFYATPI